MPLVIDGGEGEGGGGNSPIVGGGLGAGGGGDAVLPPPVLDGGEGGGGGFADWTRGPQSAQSVPKGHKLVSLPGPPSSHTPL